MDKFRSKYRIPSNRLLGFDYGSNAFYFVTICTKNREHYFGEIISNNVETHNNASPPMIINGSNELNETHNLNVRNVETHNNGSPKKINDDHNLNKMHNLNDTNELNETHNLNDINNANKTHNGASLQMTQISMIAYKYWLEIPRHYPFVTIDEFVIMPNHIHGILYINPIDKNEWIPNKFGPQSNNLGAIIRGFKSSVKRYANQNNIEFEWQSRYHDRILKDEKEYYAIKNYIINNPKNWRKDELFNNA